MNKKIKEFIISISLFCAGSLHAAFEEMPQTIDFSSFEGSVENSKYNDIAIRVGHAALNYAPELSVVFSILKKEYQINTLVETGTYQGASTQLFSILFDEVHTIEISPVFYDKAKVFFRNSPNVQCHLGSSEKVLSKILPMLTNETILFYLDAHWDSYWPLLDELEEISKTHKDNCIIVIDDFKVPGRSDIPYDYYGAHECSYQYIEKQLKKVYSDYTYYYIIPKSLQSRAKFIAIPKTFRSKFET